MPGFKTRETAWCPGCGDHVILSALQEVLEDSGLSPHQVLLTGGIGQAAKTPQYLTANAFCGLHGRALPPAVAASLVNPGLKVIIDTGDGDAYGEGGNHFLHQIRRNADITHFVHNNQIYGLTKGQASPTTDAGHVTEAQPDGSLLPSLNTLMVALAAGAGFVARSFSGDKAHLKKMMTAALAHPGYALLDILQPCVSFNKVNTLKWYQERIYDLQDAGHSTSDFSGALEATRQWGDRIPVGIFYESHQPTYAQRHPLLNTGLSLAHDQRPVAPLAAIMEKEFM